MYNLWTGDATKAIRNNNENGLANDTIVRNYDYLFAR